MNNLQDYSSFRFDDYFNITNRGFYIVGEIINGDINPGDSVLIDKQAVVIQSINTVRKTPYQPLIALQLSNESGAIKTELDKLKGKELLIENVITS